MFHLHGSLRYYLYPMPVDMRKSFYTLSGIATEVNPREWLTDVLTRIPYYNNDYSRDLAELLPHNWKAARELRKAPTEI
jgi:hypothetical protein